jgi:AraC family transcriptional regulator
MEIRRCRESGGQASAEREFISVSHVRSPNGVSWRPKEGSLTLIAPLQMLELHVVHTHKKHRYMLRRGDITLIPVSIGTECRFKGMDALVASLPLALIARTLQSLGRDSEPEMLVGEVSRVRDSLLRELTTELWDEQERGAPGGAPYAGSLGACLVGRVIKHFGDGKTETRSWRTADARIRRTLGYIEADLTGALALSEIARHVGVSVQHLSKLFKDYAGETISAYVRRRRMNLARDLLRQEEMTVAEVAHRVGYASGAHFATAFKKILGVSPGEIRKRRG